MKLNGSYLSNSNTNSWKNSQDNQENKAQEFESNSLSIFNINPNGGTQEICSSNQEYATIPQTSDFLIQQQTNNGLNNSMIATLPNYNETLRSQLIRCQNYPPYATLHHNLKDSDISQFVQVPFEFPVEFPIIPSSMQIPISPIEFSQMQILPMHNANNFQQNFCQNHSHFQTHNKSFREKSFNGHDTRDTPMSECSKSFLANSQSKPLKLYKPKALMARENPIEQIEQHERDINEGNSVSAKTMKSKFGKNSTTSSWL